MQINREDFEVFLQEECITSGTPFCALVKRAWAAALASVCKNSLQDDIIDVMVEKYGLDDSSDEATEIVAAVVEQARQAVAAGALEDEQIDEPEMET